MKFKVGDKILCKSEYSCYVPNTFSHMTFLNGCEYVILEVDIRVFHRMRIRVECDSEKSHYFGDSNICEYFYTGQEIRKIKLERLREYGV